MKKKYKIRIKAGIALLLDSIALYTLGGTIGTIMYGKENAPKELSSSFHDVVVETGIDPLINLSNKVVTAKKLDASNTSEFINYVESIENLQYVEIHNAQRLTDEEIEALNSKNLKEIILMFNEDDTLRQIYSDKKLDLNKFNNKNIIKEIKYDDYAMYEKRAFILLNYIINYEDTNFEFIKYKELDDKITNMSILLNDCNKNDILNIMDLIYREMQYLEYDPVLRKEVEEKGSLDKNLSRELKDLVYKYNVESLSTILDPEKLEKVDYNNQVKAICANYSDLFLMLCIKNKIECYDIGGIYLNDEGIGGAHSWNLINLNNKYYYVDITNYDATEKGNELIKLLIETYREEDYDKICSILFEEVGTEESNNYYSKKDVDYIINRRIERPSENYIYGTDEEKAFKFYGLTLAGTIMGIATLVVFYGEYLERKHKEK